jgi:FAD/FMN-containing dehydrogenase
MPKLTRRKIIIGCLILIIVLIARPVGHITYTWWKDRPAETTTKKGHVNDASKMNETAIDSVVKIASSAEMAVEQLTALIRTASAGGKKISIAGAQHSMGGHTIYAGGIMLDMKGFHRMSLDSVNNILQVGAGALWSEIIPYLDKYGKSVAVMQSNNSFSVGGSISVNCHGWQPNTAPIASTVESFRLINAKGEVMTCSRQENKELFSLVLGGYGLFGVILDVNLRVVDNNMYRLSQYVIKSDEYIRKYDELVNRKPDVGMVYGRININPKNFMEEAMLSVFSIDSQETLEPLKKAGYAGIRRHVFRGSANSNYGKNLRWRAEKMGARFISGKKFSRNQLINEGVEVFQNTTPGYTDILHEYFIPKDSVGRFIELLRKILPRYKTDLLNITLRNVKKDDDTFLKYAHEEVFGFVMLFNQSRTVEAEEEMKRLTQRLIDEAIALRGKYYLPYRLHATKEQLSRGYPEAADFFDLKRKYDSAAVFRNSFYEMYSR